ncbi:MAG: hypothetical protein DMG96_38815 [Acidobacteria bacterium]|nr:MAG: hypothetical protein DMG96_38815 [Acidobacteriota bacterium]
MKFIANSDAAVSANSKPFFALDVPRARASNAVLDVRKSRTGEHITADAARFSVGLAQINAVAAFRSKIAVFRYELCFHNGART